MLGEFGGKLTVGEIEIDLSHLVPFYFVYKEHGREKKDLTIRVSFSSHVFSEEVKEGAVAHFHDHERRGRCFCQSRYDVSRSLPDSIRHLLEANAWSWRMKDQNGYANLGVLADPRARLLSGTYNVVIYYFYPSGSQSFDVELNVLSCYSRPINFKKHTRREPMRNLAKQCHFNQKRVP